MWNKPFKGKVQEFYDNWLANGKHEYTDAGNMKPVPRRLIVEWVIKSWQPISNETVAKSMKSCGLALAVDGTEDDLISCFKEGKKWAEGRTLKTALYFQKKKKIQKFNKRLPLLNAPLE